MAGFSSLLVVFLLLVKNSFPLQPQDEEVNPLVEAAKALLQEQLKNTGGAGVGGIIQSFMQGDGGKQLGDMLMSASKSDGGRDVLSGIGAMLGAMTSGLDNNSGDKKSEDSVDWNSVLGLASSFISAQGGNNGGGFEGLASLLPAIMDTFGSGESSVHKHGTSVHKSHKDHSGFSPIIETLYEYWDHFVSSDFGNALWKSSGMADIAKIFIDRDGHFDMQKIFESLENNTFRRRWIRGMTRFVAEWVSHATDPATHTRYLATLQYVGNSFLQAQGYPKSALFDPKKPSESLIRLINTVFEKQFFVKIDSGTYIRPAVIYLQDVYRIGQKKGLGFSHLSANEVENKLSETLNGEIIDPLLRVWRSYKYALRNPHCSQYVMCAINQHDPLRSSSTGLKPAVTKLGSTIAAWTLSDQVKLSFWDLFNASNLDSDCVGHYGRNCKELNDFHAEEDKATTEFFHNEL